MAVQHSEWDGVRAPALMDIKELAAYLSITVRHVRRLVQDRRIPFLKVGGLLRFRRSAIDAWLDDRRVDPSE